MVAQPGVPSCWLEKHACAVHAHLNHHQAETPHTHDYLFDLAQTQTTPALPFLQIPVSLLIAALFSTQILRELGIPLVYELFWSFRVEPPPPRLLFSI
jgi:hypothetical protein